MSYKYFSEKDFAGCQPQCKMSDINESSLQRLDKCRSAAGIPFVLNSAYRSKEWDKSKGRSGTSAHTEGRAFDIRCTDGTSRYKIIKAALEVGFNRIGVGENYVHLDDSERLPQGVVWGYYK